jgi:hypothetical protein
MTDDVIKQLGLENSSIIFKGKDYFVVIKKLSKEKAEIMLSNLNEGIKKNDRFQLVMTVNGKRYLITVKVNVINLVNGVLFCEVSIVGKMSLDIKNKLDEIEERIKFLYKRNYERIFCDEATLRKFKIIPRIKVPFEVFEYPGYIKNISVNGINILTTRNVFNEKENQFMINITFQEPSESVIINGKVNRKNIINIEGTEITDMVLQFEENPRLTKRIMDYLKSEKMLSLSMKGKI